MSKIFDGGDDSDCETSFKTGNEYAKNYDIWRKKEEINKIKTKYGEEALNYDEDSSSTSDDDEDGVELTEKVEREFYKTLACLKNKDPRIYDEKVKFFADDNDDKSGEKQKKEKQKPMYLRDYERKLLLEKGGQFSDSENEDEVGPRALSPTYVQEQNQIKANLKKALNSVNDDEEDESWGGVFKARQKTKEEVAQEEEDYKQWLAGQKKDLADKSMESDLKPLMEYWNNPKLAAGEKFLRDYILNKKFLDREDADYIPTYEEVVHDSDENLSNDEEAVEQQEEFEHKYNFRFEEPDDDFIKRYPRTMENSLRKKDDKRKVKRIEVKERKLKEKEEKMQDLKKLRELKRKEIEEKIEKLKEITGNTDLEFKDDDIDGDFDPEAHDKRMQALFDDEFYQGDEEEQKPEFPEIDEELEIENWERWDGTEEADPAGPHCEDENFVMDCDYDPQRSTQDELIENTKGRKKRKRKSKFAEAVSKPKPKFDPADKTYEKYLDEYYKLDCEDFIGDLPCRFKYREVAANSFGLTVEEILLSKDRELNRWCSTKKLVQHRPDHVEKYEQIAFEKKGKNLELKRRVLPSLFSEEAEEEMEMQASGSGVQNKEDKSGEVNGEAKNKKKRRKRGNKVEEVKEVAAANGGVEGEKAQEEEKVAEVKVVAKTTNKKKKKKKKNKAVEGKVDPKVDNNEAKTVPAENNKKRKHSEGDKKNNSRNKKMKKTTPEVGMSDARLTAYGINPKKFKNKLIYGNKEK